MKHALYLGVLMLALLGVSVAFTHDPALDLRVAAGFYDTAASGFLPAYQPLFQAIKRGVYLFNDIWIPALVLGLIAGYLRHPRCTRLRRWRRPIAFLLIALIVAPGLSVEICKKTVGRPRPRDIVEFGGQAHYVPPATFSDQGGKSFISGHAAMGFYLIAFAYLLRGRQRVAMVGLTLAVGAGISISRMGMGAHFISDILWSALLTLMLIHLVYLAMGRRILPE